MDATQAIKLLEPIPIDNFIIGKYTDGQGKCCAIGHLVRLTSDDPTDYDEENCMDGIQKNQDVTLFARNKVTEFLSKRYDFWESLAGVNNNMITSSHQLAKDILSVGEQPDLIKGRVMGVLKLMQKAGY